MRPWSGERLPDRVDNQGVSGLLTAGLDHFACKETLTRVCCFEVALLCYMIPVASSIVLIVNTFSLVACSHAPSRYLAYQSCYSRRVSRCFEIHCLLCAAFSFSVSIICEGGVSCYLHMLR